MKLHRLTLNNFQGIKALTLNFKDGKSASIYGDNATGKTTVYNALTWLLFDKASTAAKNFTPKTRGADGELHYLEHSSEAVFSSDEGRIFTLKKTYKEVYKKKRGSAYEEFSGHTVEYEIDGVPVKEKDFTAFVLDFCGGDTEKPKMLTMPDYFPEQLPWDARRQILLEICGTITDGDIIESNPDLCELRDFLTMPGTSAGQYYTTDEYRKIAAAKRADINKQLTEIPARIDEAAQAMPDVTGFDINEIEKNIAKLEKEREALTEKKAALANSDTASAEIRQRIAELKTKLAEDRAEYIKNQNGKNAGTEADIIVAQKAAFKYCSEAEDIELDISRKSTEIARLEAIRNELVEQYKRVSAEVWDEDKNICPTCGQALPAGQVENMREEFNLTRSKKLEEINSRGKKQASKEQIAELYAKRDELKEKLEIAKENRLKAETRVSELQSKLVHITPYEQTEQYAALNSEISDLSDKLYDACKASTDLQSAEDKKIQAISEKIEQERTKQAKLKLSEIQQNRINELERQEKLLSGEYEKLEKGLYLCDLFTKEKVAALTEKINAKFENVRFRLFQEQINGGLKEDCEVMIPAPDGRMVPYTFANNAARINAGLEIIATLSEHWGIKMPVFIDNAESVTHLMKSDTQTVRLVVSEPDKTLRIEIEE